MRYKLNFIDKIKPIQESEIINNNNNHKTGRIK